MFDPQNAPSSLVLQATGVQPISIRIVLGPCFSLFQLRLTPCPLSAQGIFRPWSWSELKEAESAVENEVDCAHCSSRAS